MSRFLFFTVILIEMLSGVEVDLFIPSFPELQKLFNLTPFMVQLTLSVNFISYCICSLFAGTLGDSFDRRTVILASLGVFVLGSAFCVFAVNFWMLLTGRFLQGMGMAAPAVLSFVIVADEYPIEKQPALLGLMNGIITIAMAFAPVIGSYVNLYFNWRGNFVILLGLSIACLVFSYFVIPSKPGNPAVSLSPHSYLPLFGSKKLNYYLAAICFLIFPYWVFVGMAPILYMDDLGVPLKHFGFYQGTLAGVFSVVSLLSPKILQAFKQEKCFYVGTWICAIAGVAILMIAVLGVRNPIIITGMMALLTLGLVFPINILYPQSLNVVEDAKGRIAALINAIRLIGTALALELVSYFYTGSFLHMGVFIFFCVIAGVFFILRIAKNKWVSL